MGSTNKRVSAFRCSMADGTEIIMVKIKVVFEQLHLVQAKDWAAEKINGVKTGTVTIAKSAAHRAQSVTTRIAGKWSCSRDCRASNCRLIIKNAYCIALSSVRVFTHCGTLGIGQRAITSSPRLE